MLVKFEAENKLAPFQQEESLQPTKYLQDPCYILSGHSGSINEVHFSPDGKLLLSCAEEMILWKVADTIESIGSLRSHKSATTSTSWHTDSTKFASASADSTIAFQDIYSGKIIRRFKSHDSIVNCVCFLTEIPQLLLSGDDANQILIHDIREKEPIIKYKSNSPVISLAVNGLNIAVGGLCGHLFIDKIRDDPNRLELKCRIPNDDPIFGTAFKPDGRFAATLSASGILRIANLSPSCPENERIISEVRLYESKRETVPTRIVWSADGQSILAGGLDGIVRLISVEDEANPTLMYALPGHKGTVTGVDFHPSLPVIASGSVDGNVIVGELGE